MVVLNRKEQRISKQITTSNLLRSESNDKLDVTLGLWSNKILDATLTYDDYDNLSDDLTKDMKNTDAGNFWIKVEKDH